jgi:hypothetical protein
MAKLSGFYHHTASPRYVAELEGATGSDRGEVVDMKQIERHIDRLYAELNALNRDLNVRTPTPGADDERASLEHS